MSRKRRTLEFIDIEEFPRCCIICGTDDYRLVALQFNQQIGFVRSLMGANGFEATTMDFPLCTEHEDQYCSEMFTYRVVLVAAVLLSLVPFGLLMGVGERIPELFRNPMLLSVGVFGIGAYLIVRLRARFFSIRVRWKRGVYRVSLPPSPAD